MKNSFTTVTGWVKLYKQDSEQSFPGSGNIFNLIKLKPHASVTSPFGILLFKQLLNLDVIKECSKSTQSSFASVIETRVYNLSFYISGLLSG